MTVVLFHGNTGEFHSFNRNDECMIQKEVNNRLTQLNQAFLTHNGDVVRKTLTSDHVTITGGVYFGSASEVVDTLNQYSISQYQVEDEEFRILSPTSVIVNFKAHIEGCFGAKDLTGDFRVTTLWCKQKGEWKEAVYQETLIGN